jgi:ankyrin repeat protein
MNNNFFDLIKNNEYDKLYNLLLDFKNNSNNKIIDLDIKDNNYNYFIQYIIIFNQYKILKLILELLENKLIQVRLDILDNDGRTLLYNSIKYNYVEIINLLINYDKISIGISLLDIKDIFGYTSLYYTIKFNNYEIFILLIDSGTNPYIYTNDNNNAFTLCIIHKRIEMLTYLINKNFKADFISNQGKNLLQISLDYLNLNNKIDTEIIYLLFNNLTNLKIDLNNRTYDIGLTILLQTIINHNYNLFKKLLNYELDINLSDFYGNTPLHHILLENKLNYINDLNQFDINYNTSNINGDLPLHIILKLNLFMKLDISKFIKNTDLNIFNNNGESCLFLIINNNLFNKYRDELILKPLNIFVKYSENILSKELIKIAIDSYYNQLQKNKDKLLLDWEKQCFSGELDIKLCKNKIKNYMITEKKSFPKFLNNDLIIDKGIITNLCFYTGNSIDILFGLILLNNTFKKKGLDIILDYPLTSNELLNQYYKTIGLEYPNKINFSNIEIVWSFQKIFYPSYFDNSIKIKMKTSKFLVIPIGIETSIGSHANIIFWDLKNKTIERFEPNGANYPFNFNYNPLLLDNLLESKFKNFDNDIEYYSPSKFLPIIGFQFLENIETINTRKIGDPDGFCAVWCIWWIYQRMLNIHNHIEINNIANKIIEIIKLDNLNFKTIIRNFSKKITNIRDKLLKKYKLDINDWISENYDIKIVSKLEKDILNMIF